MVGAPATLHVEHNDNGNAVIKAIFKRDDFTTKETINEAIVFDLDVYCNEFNGNMSDETKAMCDVFDELPEFIQNDINESFELLAAKKEESQQEDTSTDFADDEIPFWVKRVGDEEKGNHQKQPPNLIALTNCGIGWTPKCVHLVC